MAGFGSTGTSPSVRAISTRPDMICRGPSSLVRTLIIDSRNAGNRYDLVIAGMIIIGLIGLGLDTLTRRLEDMKIVRWRHAH